MGHTYDMPLSFHRTPFIIYNPDLESVADTMHCLGLQIDAAPTIMGLLNIPYEKETMGLNLFKNARSYAYFSADDKIGCLDKEYYLIIRPENIETLYQYKDLKTDDYLQKEKARVDSMKQYMFSMMQQRNHASTILLLCAAAQTRKLLNACKQTKLGKHILAQSKGLGVSQE